MKPAAATVFEQTLEALRGLQSPDIQGGQLRELLVSAEQVRNAVEAFQAKVMVAMVDEAHEADAADEAAGLPPLPADRVEFVVDEVAVELTCTRVAAGNRLATALAARQHPTIAEAWSDGRIDARKVDVIADGLTGTDPVFADTIASSAVGYAADHTGPQLRAWLARRVISADPEAAEQRRQRATARRNVRLMPLPDGMAELVALMPAIQARHLYDTLTAAAHTLDGPDETRSLDQRRSDVLYDLGTGRATPPQVHLTVTTAADVITGTADGHVELAGYGPLTTGTLTELLTGDSRQEGAWRRLTSGTGHDKEPGYRPSAGLDRTVRARDVTCRFPGCRRSALTTRNGVDLDHTIPWPHGPTSPNNLACLCRHHHRLKHSPGWHATLTPDGAITWTTPTGRTITTHPPHHPDDP